MIFWRCGAWCGVCHMGWRYASRRQISALWRPTQKTWIYLFIYCILLMLDMQFLKYFMCLSVLPAYMSIQHHTSIVVTELLATMNVGAGNWTPALEKSSPFLSFMRRPHNGRLASVTLVCSEHLALLPFPRLKAGTTPFHFLPKHNQGLGVALMAALPGMSWEEKAGRCQVKATLGHGARACCNNQPMHSPNTISAEELALHFSHTDMILAGVRTCSAMDASGPVYTSDKSTI